MTRGGWLRRLRPARCGLEDVPVLWLGDPQARDADRVGGKAANLSRLAARWPVPDGFCLPVEVHRRIAGCGRRSAVRALRRLLVPAYRRLGGPGTGEPPVAVRSSAVEEDGAGASFAGQHDTVLNAVGPGQVADAVLRCCASAASETARTYRRAHGLDGDGAMAVLVQELVDADVSAVVFSVNPVTGDRDEVMINASYGLGEAVVDGAVTPDTYVVSRGSGALLRREVADKDVAVVRSGEGGTRQVAVAEDRRGVPALDDGRCRQLAELAVQLEEHTGWPVDLECAHRDGQLYLLQCRPITALPDS